MSARLRLHPWFRELGPEDVIRAVGGDPVFAVADFVPFGTLVSIGTNCHHFPPGSWDACFPRHCRSRHCLMVPQDEDDMACGCGCPPCSRLSAHRRPPITKERPMTTVVDETKPKDDTKPASRAGKAAPPPKAYKERLPCKLTDKEKLEIGNLLVAVDDEIDTLEDDKKSAADGFKAKIELAEGKRRELVQKLRSGEEVRAVECIERFVYERNAVEEIRTDTNQKLSERAMTADERQGKLPLEDVPPARRAPDAAPGPDGPTDITVTPDLLADAEKAALEDGAPGGAVPPRRRKKATTETPAQG